MRKSRRAEDNLRSGLKKLKVAQANLEKAQVEEEDFWMPEEAVGAN